MPTLIFDCDGVLVDWNPQAEATFGWARDEAIGRVLAETILPESGREAHRARRAQSPRPHDQGNSA